MAKELGGNTTGEEMGKIQRGRRWGKEEGEKQGNMPENRGEREREM